VADNKAQLELMRILSECHLHLLFLVESNFYDSSSAL
jgi:hypothetical protein